MPIPAHIVNRCFAPLESSLLQLLSGYADTVDDIPVFRDADGQLKHLAPAIAGWCELWARAMNVCKLWSAFDPSFREFDLAPLHVIASRLAHDEMLDGEEQVREAIALTAEMKQAAIKYPLSVFQQIANDISGKRRKRK